MSDKYMCHKCNSTDISHDENSCRGVVLSGLLNDCGIQVISSVAHGRVVHDEEKLEAKLDLLWAEKYGKTYETSVSGASKKLLNRIASYLQNYKIFNH